MLWSSPRKELAFRRDFFYLHLANSTEAPMKEATTFLPGSAMSPCSASGLANLLPVPYQRRTRDKHEKYSNTVYIKKTKMKRKIMNRSISTPWKNCARGAWGCYVSSSGVTEASLQSQQHAFLCPRTPIFPSLAIWFANNLKILTKTWPLFGGSLDLGLWVVFFASPLASISLILCTRRALALLEKKQRYDDAHCFTETERESMEKDRRKGMRCSLEPDWRGAL